MMTSNRIAAVVISLLAFVSCEQSDNHALFDQAATLPEERAVVTQKLRQYCAACHGIGELRFIYSIDDLVVWQELFTRVAPVSNEVWAKAIIAVLSWPTNAPPPTNEWIEYPIRDWMPKGIKRMELAADTHGAVGVRQLIIDQLRDGIR